MKQRESKISKLYRKMHRHYVKNHIKRAKMYQKLIRLLFSCELPYKTSIGDHTELVHGGLGCVFHENAVIGKNCKIFQNVTIGGLPRCERAPRIGDNVLIGAGAVVLGDVTVGDNAKIGANAVVLNDVPEGATAVGVPAATKLKK